MTRNPFRLGLLSAALLCAPLRAEDPALRELLRDALYTEEVTRDPEKAATQYEEILSRHAEQQSFAASALFRLAEVRRKQDRKDDAIALYQRLFREFPAAVTEAKLAAENLAALGAEVPEAGEALSDEESKELLRLKALEKTGPDLLKDPKALENAANKGWLRVAGFLLDVGNDPYRSDAFIYACTSGYLEICRLMLDKCGNPPEHLVNEAMASALRKGRLEVVKLLLQKGFKPDPSELLAISVRKNPSEWEQETTSFILQAGSDVNRMPAETSEPFADNNRRSWSFGTPLHDALSWRNIEAANFLLDQGCKPDLPTADDGITPLHIALYLEEKGALELVRRLLAAGADPNRGTLKMPEWPPNSPRVGIIRNSQWEDLSPLEIAIDYPSVENAKLLLEAGAKTDSSRVWEKAFSSKNAEFVDLLLQSDSKPPLPELLAMAVRFGNLPAATRLLDAGASPQSPGLLEDAVKTKNLPLVQLLFERGVVPDEGWVRGQLQRGNWDEIGPLLFQRFLIPILLEKPAITFFSPQVGWNSTQELATQAGSAPPSSLPELLLAAKELSWPSTTFPGNEKSANYLTRWRKDDQGKPAAIHVRLDRSDPLPDLQWGDVIELDFDPTDDGQAGQVVQPRNVEFRSGPSAGIAWALQRRISFPVTLEIDGVHQDLTLRGDRLIHDPTSKEVPWCTAGALAGIRWQPGFALGDMGMTLSITRKEWPEVRLPFPSDEASLFMLRSGDQVKLETTPKVAETITAIRKEYIGFRAAGLPYARMLRCATGSRHSNDLEYPAPMLPTLCQIIAQSQAVPAEWSEFTELSPDWIPANLRSSAAPVTVLPHPDWSRIRILRLKDDGTGEAIEVNLSRWIEEAGPNATAEEIKKGDIPLQPGDIVELRVHEDRLGQPWKGISPAEETFLAKALQGRVQIIGIDSQMRLEEIRFKAAASVETPAGWIPLPSRSGVQSAQASSLLGDGNPIGVTRNGAAFDELSRSAVFLRDGDQIKFGGEAVGRPIRQRVSPSGPSR